MRLAAAALALLLAVPALAKEVAGVKVPDTATAGMKSLSLNGAGVRSKMFVKVYVGALYTEQKVGDLQSIVGADASWQVTMVFKRDVDKDKILSAFREGFENNSKADLPKVLPALDVLATSLKDFKEGDVFTIAYQPGGSTLTPPGGAPITVAGKAFGDALLRNWLGSKPADGDLKAAMLGK